MRWVASLLRGLLLLLGLAIILLALYVSLGRQLVPVLADYREDILLEAQELLPFPVEIERLEGLWEGFSPHLVAHGVQLGEGSQRLRLAQVDIRVDVLASLKNRLLTFSHLAVYGLEFSLAEDAQGHWQVEGMPPRTEQPLDIQQLVELKRHFRQLQIRQGQLILKPYGKPAQRLQAIDLGLTGTLPNLTLAGRAQLDDNRELLLKVTTEIHPQDWQRSALDVYLRLPQVDWAGWLPHSWQLQPEILQLLGGGEAWVRLDERHMQSMVAQLYASQALLARGTQEPLALRDLGVTLYSRHQQNGYEVVLSDMGFRQGPHSWGPVQLNVVHKQDAEEAPLWQVFTPLLPLDPLLEVVNRLGPWPTPLKQLLDSLSPQGRLKNVVMTYRPTAHLAQRLQYTADLDRLAFQAQGWVPAVSNLSGHISGDLSQGRLQLDSTGFGLHIEPLFANKWRYLRTTGELLWQLEDEAITLKAPYLFMEGDEGQIAADFLLRLYSDPAAEDYMDLRVGLQNSDVRFRDRYLPTGSAGLSSGLNKWLQHAIRQGRIDQGLFQYQGSIEGDGSARAHSLGLYLSVADGQVNYLDGWPLLEQAQGEVLLENGRTRIHLDSGRLLDSQVRQLEGQIAQDDNITTLALKGKLRGPARNALGLLQKGPLAQGDTFHGWVGKGTLETALDLQIPLDSSRSPQGHIDFSTQKASLQMAQTGLTLTRLSGAFRYDLQRGLSASRIRAQVLGHELRGRAVATGRSGQPGTRLEMSGQVPLTRLLGWLDQQALTIPARGSIPYDLRLDLGRRQHLQVESSLRGLAIDLPAPFGKSAAQSRVASLQMDLSASETHLKASYAHLAQLLFTAPGQNWQAGRGELRLGRQPARLPSIPGLRIRGEVSSIDWNAWQGALKPYTQRRASSTADRSLGVIRDARVHIGEILGLGTQITDLTIRLDPQPQNQGWRLAATSDLVVGQILIPPQREVPLQVRLDHLQVPVSTSDKGQSLQRDPLSRLQPGSVPPMDINIRRVWLGSDPLGALALKFRPTKTGVDFRDLNLDLRGVKVTGNAGWAGDSSWFKGRLAGKNLAHVLTSWGFAPSATSQRFQVDIDGHWPGSPAWFNLERFSGSLKSAIYNGRFVEIEGGANALKIFGLLNFNALGRRLRLDFSDLFGEGLSFDQVEGHLEAHEGVYVTRTPLTLLGPSSNLVLNGQLDMVRNHIDAKLLVTLPVSNNLPLLAVLAGAPVVGGALWVADTLLGDNVARFSTVQYQVEGPWQAPRITFDKPFERPR